MEAKVKSVTKHAQLVRGDVCLLEDSFVLCPSSVEVEPVRASLY